MDKITIKLNKFEYAWVVAVVKSAVFFQEPGISKLMIWAAVMTLKRRLSRSGIVVIKKSNSITLNGAEALVMWNIIGGTMPLDHEIAWKLGVQQKMEKAIEKLEITVRNSVCYEY